MVRDKFLNRKNPWASRLTIITILESIFFIAKKDTCLVGKRMSSG
jgi:hypothetical protein